MRASTVIVMAFAAMVSAVSVEKRDLLKREALANCETRCDYDVATNKISGDSFEQCIKDCGAQYEASSL